MKSKLKNEVLKMKITKENKDIQIFAHEELNKVVNSINKMRTIESICISFNAYNKRKKNEKMLNSLNNKIYLYCFVLDADEKVTNTIKNGHCYEDVKINLDKKDKDNKDIFNYLSTINCRLLITPCFRYKGKSYLSSKLVNSNEVLDELKQFLNNVDSKINLLEVKRVNNFLTQVH